MLGQELENRCVAEPFRQVGVPVAYSPAASERGDAPGKTQGFP
jgi:hypothetical protein